MKSHDIERMNQTLIRRPFRRFLALACFALFAACTLPANAGETLDDALVWRPALPDGAERPWAIILPGASGLRIFDDAGHYERFAGWLNQQNIDVLVIDYKRATRFLPDTQKGKPGPRIAGIVRHALARARASGRLVARCPGYVFGWSLGGEGALTLARSDTAGDPAIRGIVGLYPSVRGQEAGFKAAKPILLLQGSADKVTPPVKLDTFVAGARALGGSAIETRIFGGVSHGFDVESLARPRGPLRYDQQASDDARKAITAFLGSYGLSCAP